MDDYGMLREFADSWGLLALVLVFLGVVLFAFRPGSGRHHAEMAAMPLRNEDRPLADNDGTKKSGGRG